MALLRPDPTFYPSPRIAMQAPPEKLAYVATLNYGSNDKPDALAVVDLNPESDRYSQVIHMLRMPYVGDELHHYGWSCCSSALCPAAPHLERCYLVVPAEIDRFDSTGRHCPTQGASKKRTAPRRSADG